LFVCFVTMLVTWMSFASVVRELRRGVLIMLETHIMMSSLIFCLALTLVLFFALSLVFCLVSLMDLTIAHEIALLARKFCVLYKFRKERRRCPRGYFECGDTTHFITDYLKSKKLDSSNKYDYTKRNDYSKGDNKKKYRFKDKRRKSFRR
jgi:hypothetical protein